MTGSLGRPFDAYLPRPDVAPKVVAPPYDSVTIEETRRLVADNPLSFLNLVRSEVDHPERTGEERRVLLGEAAARLRTLIADGVYEHYPYPVFFVCRLSQHGHSQTGVIADVPVAAYDGGLVKVHESTRKGQEDRLVEYMEAVRANFLPLFLIHRPIAAVDRALIAGVGAAPAVDIDAGDGLRVTFWVVDEPDEVRRWEEALGAVEVLYVADGHHRAAAASRFAAAQRVAYPDADADGPPQRMLAGLFPSDQLVIQAYHRCVSDLGALAPDAFLAALADRFQLEPAVGDAVPQGGGEVGVHVAGSWHRLTFPERLRRRGVAGLDVSLLQDHVLGPLLGVTEPRADPRLEVVPGTLGVDELERMCQSGFAAAFALYPPYVDDLLDVADRGEVMPPKSTWFAPKLPSGLVVRLL